MDKILDATESVNDLLCTNYNPIDYSKEYGHRKFLLVNCENGIEPNELNRPIEILKSKLTSPNFTDKSPPYCMTRSFISDFEKRFDLKDDGNEKYRYSKEIVLKAMVPGQRNLIERINRLMNFYCVPDDKRPIISRLSEGCENDNCCAKNFIAFDGEKDDTFPVFPKLRNVLTYKFDDRFFEDPVAAKDYLERLGESLTYEETNQCVVCDILQYFNYKATKEQREERKYDLDCLPDVHPFFYQKTSMHDFFITEKILSQIKLITHENGTSSILFKDEIYS